MLNTLKSNFNSKYFIENTYICFILFFKANFERWCRLRGNLLFYLKSHDQLSDLLGVIVLQNYSVQLDESPPEGPFSFQIGNIFSS